MNLRYPQVTDPLLRTLEDLAALGEKRVGTEAGARAGAYVHARFVAAGLEEVRFDPFHFPRHDVLASSLALSAAGSPLAIGHDVLEGAGAGAVRAPVIAVGQADDPLLLASLDLEGKVALVDRNPILHRSTQYERVAQAGAAALLYVSSAPANLRQVGSIRRAWEACGAIPALAIGATDGVILKAALEARRPVWAELALSIAIQRGRGQNVLGVVAGQEPYRLVVGAHYDTWFAGSTDNGGGVAALLALAERRARRPPPRYTLEFVAWDGEEVALYGGYHYLRRSADPSLLAVIDLETPSAHGAQAYGLARSGHPSLEQAIVAVGLHDLYALNVPMDLVPELFGGVIPTDIQGLYRGGTPTVATAVDSPYYHTVEDTPDKVDLVRLVETIEGFDRALDRLLDEPPERFLPRDRALWTVQVTARAFDTLLLVDVRVCDGLGRARPAASVEAVLFHDHFFESATRRARTDAAGCATMVFPATSVLDQPPPRYLHVTAGDRHPLAELVLALD